MNSKDLTTKQLLALCAQAQYVHDVISEIETAAYAELARRSDPVELPDATMAGLMHFMDSLYESMFGDYPDK